MQANNIRKLYLDFFKSKLHKISKSAPMVVKNDPTLMFTNAGMNQFKANFLGDFEPIDFRVANSQKCLRVSGKHNDLEEVGHDTYHHTMFEMLGSWSFGDYFKKDTIDWAWEFLVDVCHLDKNRLYVTVFEGSGDDKLEKDHESFKFWRKHLPEERILNGSKLDNFWEMGDTGPCGPCSEIHFDNRCDEERKKISALSLVNRDHPQVIEIWNLVFMQYNRFVDGSLSPLPKNHVDTGMGLERLAMIMQGVKSNYDTDIFQPVICAISSKTGVNYGDNEKKDIAMRVMADHIRAIAFSIADGQLPSNVKAGYVIRRILRRSVRYAYTFLNISEAFLYELVEVLANQMGKYFPELAEQKDLIQKVVKEEEESFLRTLSDGLKRIDQLTQKPNAKITGMQVFELYDTYGFPLDLTSLILSEKNLSFKQKEFDVAMNLQKERSKKAGKIIKGDWKTLLEDDIQEFVGYNDLEVEVSITRYREVKYQGRLQYQLVFNVTPFYPEGGGQVGDIGFIQSLEEKIPILETKKENNLIVHLSDTLPLDLTQIFNACVNIDNREACSRNHTATHLLHEALRVVLGDHVSQKGSFVNHSYLRFDFTHFSRIEKRELKQIEMFVNAKILSNIELKEHQHLPLSKAEDLGAMMLFGEKYDDVVRMIQFDTSKELCGGTHVNATGEIGLFKILSEVSTSSGIRRIEAITGYNSINYLNDKEDLLNEIGFIIKNKDLKSGVEKLVASNKQIERKLAEIKNKNTGGLIDELLNSVTLLNGIKFIAKLVAIDAQEMKNISFKLRKEKNMALVLASTSGGKALLSVMLTDDLIEKGLDAVIIIKRISKAISGGGGGQAFFATAGGSNVDGLEHAIDLAREIIIQ